MNNKVNCGLMFIAGAVLGACGGYLFAKKKYEVIADEEIESVKEAFNETSDDLNNKLNKLSIEAAEKLVADKGDSPMDYAKKVEDKEVDPEDESSAISKEEVNNIFENYGSKQATGKKPEIPVVPTPYVGNDPIYVIRPDEYGEFENYNLVSLTLTKDGFLLDDKNEVIDDPIGAIGEDSLSHMGEYEDDAVHVRNDIRQCDYEVLLDLRTLNDILGG